MSSSLGFNLSAFLPSVISSQIKLNRPVAKSLLRALVAIAAVCLLGGGLAHARPVSFTRTVSTTADDATGVAANCAPGSSTPCTLRDAITAANADSGDTIEFTVTGTITLTSALPQISANMTITGPGASQLTVSGAGSYLLFQIEAGANATISGLTLANGSNAGTGGGGIYSSGQLAVSNSTFLNNVATSRGGGIYNDSSATLTVTNCTFTNNSTGGDGGGIVNLGQATVTHSTFSNNIAGWAGGALSSTGPLVVVDSTLFNNSANGGGGGGIYFFHGGSASVTGSTVTGNRGGTPYGGGGIYADDGGTLTMTNSIVSWNTIVISSGTSYNDVSSVWGNYSDDGGNVVGYASGLPSAPPAAIQLAPLGNYGGPTQTMLPLPGSAAICAGLLSNVPSGTTTDQRGWPLSPSTCPSGYVDAGAVQTNYSVIDTLVDSLNTVDATSCTDGTETATNLCSLRDAITQANTAGYADVDFAPSLFVSGTKAVATPGTIVLGLGSAGDLPLPTITGTLNLIGPGANLLTVSGDGDTNVGSILQFASAATGYVEGITFANGLQSSGGQPNHGGGAIANQGTLTVQNDVFAGNQSQNISGGAIVNAGTINILDSNFSGNTSGNYGGAFFNCCVATATVVNSTFTGNTSASDGGAIFSFSTLTVDNSTVVGNTAKAGSGGGINTYCAGATSAINNSIVAGNSATGLSNFKDVGYADCGTAVAPAESSDLIGLPTGMSKVSQILGSLAYTPATASVQVMMPLPGTASILCQGSASLLPAGMTTDERGFPTDPQCDGAIDLGAVQTNYTGIAFKVPNGVVGQTLTPATSIQVQETNALTGAVDGAGGIPVSWWLTGYPSPYTGSPLKPTHGASTTSVVKTAGVPTDNLVTLSGLSVSTANTYSMSAQVNGTKPQESNSFIIDAATVTQLAFTKPPASTVDAGALQTVKVTMESVDGIPITSATGSITLNVTGPNGYTPRSYIVAAVNGTAAFIPQVLLLSGTYTYHAYLTANNAVTSSAATQNVAALAPVLMVVSGYPATWWVGVPADATVSVLDKYGNLSPTSVIATIGSNDPKATINPAQVTIDRSAQVSVTFANPGTRYITATTATAAIVVVPERNIIIQTVPHFVVNSSGDSGAGASDCTPNPTATKAGTCTLRDALAAAQNAGEGTITFDPTVFAAANTIALANGMLTIPPNTTITGLTTGSGASLQNLVTIDGAGASQIFTVASGVTGVSIANLTLQHAVGSAVFNQGALSISSSTFSGNSTYSYNNDGACIENSSSGRLTVSNSTFSGNHSIGYSNYGGCIYNAGTLTVVNSTFSSNSASGLGLGGAIMNDGGGSLRVSDSTFSGNSAGSSGGAIANYGTLTLANSIVSGNNAGGIADDIDGGYSDAGGNVVGYFNGNAVNTTPIDLAPLGNYGGSIQTMIPLPGSPAICAGLIANIPATATKDERGLPNTNTSYPGYSKTAPCVDAGAVQTNYSLALTPKSISAAVGKAITPAPVVTLSESGKTAAYAAGTIQMTDANGAFDASSTTSVGLNAGSATFSNLIIETPGSDSLTASLALNPAANLPVVLSQTSAPFTVAGQPQAITITVTPSGTQYAGASATLSATDTSNQVATFSTTSTNCTVNGNSVNYSAAGSCVINASVPANLQYAAATASKTITVALNPQTITMTVTPSGTQYAGASATLSATDTSNQVATFSTTSTNCTVNGNSVSYSATGSCVINASVPGNSQYAAATASKTITVALNPQTITLQLPTVQQYVGGSATQGTTAGPSTFVATASSGLPVSVNSLTTICTVTGETASGFTISYLAPGTCTIVATQAGDQTKWAAAPGVPKSITVKAK